VKQLGANNVNVQSDSQLVVGEMNREYEAKGEKIKLHLQKALDAKDKLSCSRLK
jgi:ribonuclease HI